MELGLNRGHQTHTPQGLENAMPILGSSQDREGHRWHSWDQEQRHDHQKVTLAFHTQSHSQCLPSDDPAWGQSTSSVL